MTSQVVVRVSMRYVILMFTRCRTVRQTGRRTVRRIIRRTVQQCKQRINEGTMQGVEYQYYLSETARGNINW
jgi:hypothetical protein